MPRIRTGIIAGGLLLLSLAAGCRPSVSPPGAQSSPVPIASPEPPAPAGPAKAHGRLGDSLRSAAVVADESGLRSLVPAVARAMSHARVIGLGEATHGQHEAFEFKRALTMHLVAHGGVRIVAYEASASSARACDDYVSGRSDNRRAAVAGLGMLIWAIEENAALLDDLRAWNAAAAPADRVRFIGVDVQDAPAAAARLAALIEARHPPVAARARALPARLEPAVRELWAGRIDDWVALDREAQTIQTVVAVLSSDLGEEAEEAVLRARELRLAVGMFRTAGGRDAAMAEMLLAQLPPRAPDDPPARAVLWGHNQHIMLGRLAYLGTQELGAGGCLAATLGREYFALGVAFGRGSFHALDQDASGAWRFRPYTLAAPPSGGLDETLAGAFDSPAFLDLGSLEPGSPAAAWAAQPGGFMWFGGYRVPAEIESGRLDASSLVPATLSTDYDGLLFLPTTTPSKPLDADRLWSR